MNYHIIFSVKWSTQSKIFGLISYLSVLPGANPSGATWNLNCGWASGLARNFLENLPWSNVLA
jgi:hypothetical protein